MFNKQIKGGLIVLAIFQIAAIFYMLNFYNKLVSNPDNYYKDILVDRDKINAKMIEDASSLTN